MRNYQPGVLAPVPLHGRYLTFRLTSRLQARRALRALGEIADGESCVVGPGLSLLRALNSKVPGMRRFPASARKGARAVDARRAGKFCARGLHDAPLDATRAGLVFVAFGCSLYAFEAQLKRMVGMDDGIVDALFKFTQPVTGAYFWCPPVARGRLDLKAFL